ncbi:hypothetical protein BZJ19_04320 [Salinivibrio proteolyticus]|uniref:hypothetical protein n=1 Tax=Salinivibrio proteolyticus TaxID=334715 RepID=UPI000989745D|nr:hypothetical protein [Salinivibrio proteolyticus]OOF26366.1 hypothetical protein BZJ19_04320 [Salinivibrio proteolyticus]
MDSRSEFYLSCANCGDTIHLTHDHLATLKNGSAIACECGALLHSDDEKFGRAKAILKERQKAKYLIWSGAAIATFLAFAYRAPATTILISLGTGFLVRNLGHGEVFEMKTKLAPLNEAPSVTFSTFEEFKASHPKLKYGFNKAFNKCCICESFTKQTINEFPVCGVCSSPVHARS